MSQIAPPSEQCEHSSQPDEASHSFVPAMSNGEHTTRLIATSDLTADDEIVLSMGHAISDPQDDGDLCPTIDANPLYRTVCFSPLPISVL